MTEGIAYGDYYLLGRLNQGGMAEVFLGKSRDPTIPNDRLLAVKRLLPSYSADPDIVKMFADEARIAKKLHHPNICEVIDEGRQENQLFIAMEFVHGKDLKVVQHRVQKAGEAIPYRLIAFMLARIADALEYAHTRRGPRSEPENIVHRDVSPQNILVGYDGVPKLIDFGIAKAKNRVAETRVGVVKGKFGYMSPEQVSGGAVDGRSDIFALGIVLYELLVGQPPFKGTNDISVLRKIARADYTSVRVANADVPKPLADIVERALALDPTKRYQRAADMSADFMRYLREGKQPVDEAVLSAYMRKLFREDYVKELARVKQYMAAKVPVKESLQPDTRPGVLPKLKPEVLPEGRTEVAPTFMLAAGFNVEGEQEITRPGVLRRRERDDDMFDFRPISEDEVRRGAQSVGALFDERTTSSEIPPNMAGLFPEEKTSVMPPMTQVPKAPPPRRNPDLVRTSPMDAPKTSATADNFTDAPQDRPAPAGFVAEITKEEEIPKDLGVSVRSASSLREVLDAVEKRPSIDPREKTKPVPTSLVDKTRADPAPVAVPLREENTGRDLPPVDTDTKNTPIAPTRALERDDDLAKFAADLVKKGGEAPHEHHHSPLISRGEGLILVVAAMLGLLVIGICYLYALNAPLPDAPLVEDIGSAAQLAP